MSILDERESASIGSVRFRLVWFDMIINWFCTLIDIAVGTFECFIASRCKPIRVYIRIHEWADIQACIIIQFDWRILFPFVHVMAFFRFYLSLSFQFWWSNEKNFTPFAMTASDIGEEKNQWNRALIDGFLLITYFETTTTTKKLVGSL